MPVFVRVRDRDVFVVDVGVGDLPVVLHSGWIGTWEDWLPQIEALSRVTRVIAYDHRGTGRTVATPDEITHDGLVRDLFDLLDVTGIHRCVVGGFSSGASVVTDAITARPDRFAGVLLMCPVFPDPDPNFLSLLDSDLDGTIELFLDLCFPEAAHRDVSSTRRWAHSVLHQSSAENAVQLMLALQAAHAMDQYAPVALPTAIVMGSDDPMSNENHLGAWTRLFPDARVTTIPRAGHIVAFTAPDAVNRAFLDLVNGIDMAEPLT